MSEVTNLPRGSRSTSALFDRVIELFAARAWGRYAFSAAMLTTLKLTGSVLLLGLLLMGTGCQVLNRFNPPAPAPGVAAARKPSKTFVVAYMTLDATQLPAWVAKESGLFAKQGIDVELRYMPSLNAVIQDLQNGEIQAFIGVEDALRLDMTGADFVYVGAPSSRLLYSLYASSKITDPSDLRKSKIGTAGNGSITYQAARLALKAIGLNPSTDGEFVSVGIPGASLQVIKAGGIDAGLMDPTLKAQAKQAGLKEVVSLARADAPAYPAGWPAVSRGFIAVQQDAVARFVRALVAAVAFEINNPDETQRIFGQYTQISDAAALKASYDEIVPLLQRDLEMDQLAVRNALDEVSLIMPVARVAQPETFIDRRFLREVDTVQLLRSLYPSGTPRPAQR